MNGNNSYLADFNSGVSWRRERAENALLNLRDGSRTDHRGVLRWKSNDSVPPRDLIEFGVALGEKIDVAACDAARDADFAAFAAEYRAARARMSPEQVAEQRAEARAAVGPGVEMVNVITGERFRT